MIKGKYDKVLLIGIDGMDPKISNACGALPSKRRLAKTNKLIDTGVIRPKREENNISPFF
jgi:hypothetical protein